MMTLLDVRGVSKAFGGVRAVDQVSFAVNDGQLVALLGPNGAGKSTCFNVINGQLRPDAGEVRLAGHALIGMKPRDIWRAGIGRTFQVAATFGSLSVVENVQMALVSREHKLFRFVRPASEMYREEALDLLDQVGMRDEARRTSSVLSYGDVKRLELAIALANRPRLLLMDEPTAGMAPGERHALMALTKSLAVKRNMGVLFTEHSMDVVFAYADLMVVLARGRVIATGPADAIRNDARVREVYFGAVALPQKTLPGRHDA
jgi:branched-chain amino acid transport system ATP-binding protein